MGLVEKIPLWKTRVADAVISIAHHYYQVLLKIGELVEEHRVKKTKPPNSNV